MSEIKFPEKIVRRIFDFKELVNSDAGEEIVTDDPKLMEFELFDETEVVDTELRKIVNSFLFVYYLYPEEFDDFYQFKRVVTFLSQHIFKRFSKIKDRSPTHEVFMMIHEKILSREEMEKRFRFLKEPPVLDNFRIARKLVQKVFENKFTKRELKRFNRIIIYLPLFSNSKQYKSDDDELAHIIGKELRDCLLFPIYTNGFPNLFPEIVCVDETKQELKTRIEMYEKAIKSMS